MIKAEMIAAQEQHRPTQRRLNKFTLHHFHVNNDNRHSTCTTAFRRSMNFSRQNSIAEAQLWAGSRNSRPHQKPKTRTLLKQIFILFSLSFLRFETERE